MNRSVLVVLMFALGCGSWPFGEHHPYAEPDDLERPADEIDLAGIERNGASTDVIAEYWSRSFSSLGEEDTFRLFDRKHELLAKDDPVEADAAVTGFRRLCRLRGSLSAFDLYWEQRFRNAPSST